MACTALFACVPLLTVGFQEPGERESDAGVPAPGVTVQGIVRDSLHQPVPAARVVVRHGVDGEVVAQTMSDGEGQFVLSRVTPAESGWVLIQADAPGCWSGWEYLAPGELERDVVAELRLFPGTEVRVAVRDAEGRPVPDAHVMLIRNALRDVDYREMDGTTDAEGVHVFDDCCLGDSFVRAWAPGYTMAEQRVDVQDGTGVALTLVEGGGRSAEIRLEGADEAEGVVSSWHLRPFRRGTYQPLPRPLREGSLDAGGTARLSGLPSDMDMRASVSVQGLALRARTTTTDGDPIRIVATVEEPVTFRLNGRIRCGDDPLESVRIEGRGATRVQATTDGEGRFALEVPVRPGSRPTLRLLHDELILLPPSGLEDPFYNALERVQVEAPGDEPLELRAARGLRVAGRVVYGEQRRPATRARVEVGFDRPGVSPSDHVLARGRTDSEGRFEIRGLPDPRGLPLWIRAESFRGQVRSDAVVVDPGGQHDYGALELQPSGTVEGTVRDSTGVPRVGALVWLRPPSGDIFETMTDREGRYRFVGLWPDPHRIEFFLQGEDGEREGGGTVDVAPGKTLRVDHEWDR